MSQAGTPFVLHINRLEDILLIHSSCSVVALESNIFAQLSLFWPGLRGML